MLLRSPQEADPAPERANICLHEQPAARPRCGPKWSRCCRRGRSTRWAATTRGCRTARRWTRSFSCCAPGASGTRCGRRASARPPRRTGASRNGPRRGVRGVLAQGAAGLRRAGRDRLDVAGAGRGDGQGAARGGKNRPQPDGPGQTRGQALAAHRRPRRAPRGGDRRGQPQRPQADAPTIEAIPVRRPRPTCRRPQHLCLDKGFDYDEPRALAQEFGFILHLRTPRRGGQGQVPRPSQGATMGGGAHAPWLDRFRSILIRWAKKPSNYLALLHFALAIITWRHALPG